MKYQTQAPFVASYIIFRDGDKVAFVLRSNTGWMNNYYGLPSGKVEKSESFLQAAVREAKEEVGVEVAENSLTHVLTMHRKSQETGDNEWVDLFFEAQKWRGELFNAEPHMHSELTWLDTDKLPENTIPNVKFALEQISNGIFYCEFGWVN